MIFLALLFFPSLIFGDDRVELDRDSVMLKDGKKLEGRVLFEDDDKLLLRVKSKVQNIPKNQLSEVDSIPRKMQKYLEESQNPPAESRAEWFQKLKNSGLEREAQLEAWRVLRQDPENEEAHDFLAHKKKSGKWLYPEGSDWLSWLEICKRKSDWNKAWEFETEHFRFRSDQDLFPSQDLARDFERFYVFAYRMLQRAEPWEIVKPVSVYLYKEEKEFPSRGTHSGAYFEPTENRLYLPFQEKKVKNVFFHELTHAILYNAIVRDESGKVPAWLDEGLGEYFSWLIEGEIGAVTFSEGAKHESYFEALRKAPKPFPFKTMLSFNTTDFYASSKQELRYAQCYTYVHFFIHGDHGKHRNSLLDFLSEVSKDTATPTRFLDVIGAKPDAIEEGWLNYLGR